MKKFVLMICAALLIGGGCSKTPPANEETTYSIQSLLNTSSLSQSYPGSTITIDILAREYNDAGECVDIETIDDIQYADRHLITANKLSKKVTIRVSTEMEYNGKTASVDKWIQQVFYLEEDDNTEVVITDETIVGNNEPI